MSPLLEESCSMDLRERVKHSLQERLLQVVDQGVDRYVSDADCFTFFSQKIYQRLSTSIFHAKRCRLSIKMGG